MLLPLLGSLLHLFLQLQAVRVQLPLFRHQGHIVLLGQLHAPGRQIFQAAVIVPSQVNGLPETLCRRTVAHHSHIGHPLVVPDRGQKPRRGLLSRLPGRESLPSLQQLLIALQRRFVPFLLDQIVNLAFAPLHPGEAGSLFQQLLRLPDDSRAVKSHILQNGRHKRAQRTLLVDIRVKFPGKLRQSALLPDPLQKIVV